MAPRSSFWSDGELCLLLHKSDDPPWKFSNPFQSFVNKSYFSRHLGALCWFNQHFWCCPNNLLVERCHLPYSIRREMYVCSFPCFSCFFITWQGRDTFFWKGLFIGVNLCWGRFATWCLWIFSGLMELFISFISWSSGNCEVGSFLGWLRSMCCL